ncbi:sugar phosphate isomerase/epimerase family protein [Streptomyces iranensis]|uniref:sugar phosphate isomerase/epimerase family protein n=1 Tax=Streptomyces iranensis TaxID=576784 RepID=UPI0039B76862
MEISLSVDLIATCWTTAGACEPLSSDDRSPLPIRQRVEAASEAGFRGFGIRHGDLREVEETLGFSAFRRMLDDHGMVHVELEFLGGWSSDDPEVRSASAVLRADLLRAAEALGARHIKVGGVLAAEGGTLDTDRVATRFARLAEDAAQAGTMVGLEPMPFFEIRTPQIAQEIVEKAGHPSGGLFLDVWHVARAGVDYEDIAALSARQIVGVELDDASQCIVGTLWEDTHNARLFPGEGDLNVKSFVSAVKRTGYTGPFGIEMLSSDFRKLPLAEAVQRAYSTTRSVTTSA